MHSCQPQRQAAGLDHEGDYRLTAVNREADLVSNIVRKDGARGEDRDHAATTADCAFDCSIPMFACAYVQLFHPDCYATNTQVLRQAQCKALVASRVRRNKCPFNALLSGRTDCRPPAHSKGFDTPGIRGASFVVPASVACQASGSSPLIASAVDAMRVG
jgi:hypothetical protein